MESIATQDFYFKWDFYEVDPEKGNIKFDMYRVTSVGFSTDSTEPGAYELM
jgi:hypothetical protein